MILLILGIFLTIGLLLSLVFRFMLGIFTFILTAMAVISWILFFILC